MRFISVDRAEGIDAEQFMVRIEPRFPELEISAPRYAVPDDDWDELEYISLDVGNRGAWERHYLTWGEIPLQLDVQPSRGGLDAGYLPEEFEARWERDKASYNHGDFLWGKRPNYDVITDVYWDDGAFRFHLQVDLEEAGEDVGWDLSDVREIVDALSVEG